MNTLTKEDLKWAVTRLPKRVVDLLRTQGDKVVIAGGYIRSCIANEPINDIDIFIPSKEVGEALAKSLVLKTDDSRLISTDNAFTVTGYKYSLQFIHRWTYNSPEEIVPSFDFTIARAAIWYDLKDGWKSLCDASFYPDLAAKRLVYCSPQRNEDAGGSMLRVLKFYQRGYRIPLDSLGAVIGRLLQGVQKDNCLFWEGRNKDGKRPPEGEVEAHRGKILSGLLREVDPNIDPTHISHLPSSTDETLP